MKAFYSGIYDYDISNLHTYSDDIVWDSYGGYYGDYVHGDAPVLNATRMTIGHILGAYDSINGQGSAGTGFFIGPGTDGTTVTNTVTDSIFWNDPSYGVADDAVSDYNSFWSNGANYGGAYATPVAGAHDLTTDLTAGLKYLPRIEAGSTLATAGSSGGPVGASVVYMWGTTGTLWGDPGYDTVTSASIWPFPNEGVIKADMAGYSGPGAPGARGFATGTSKDGSPQTLTKYIWEYLGNQIPADVYGFHIETASLPSGTVGVAYQATLAAAGGTSPYGWSVTGSLPPGLTLDVQAGAIQGTPTMVGTTAITLVASDAAMPPLTAMQQVQIQILPVGQSPDGGNLPTGQSSDGGSLSAGQSPDGGSLPAGQSLDGGSPAGRTSSNGDASGGCGCRLDASPERPIGLSAVGVLMGLGLLLRRRRPESHSR